MDEIALLRSIIEAKEQAKRNETRRNLIRLLVVASATLAYIVWAWQTTATSEDLYRIFMPVIPVALVIADLGMWLLNSTVFPKHSQCPACGHSWETKSYGRVVSNRLLATLDSCPGCDTPITDPRLKLALKDAEIRALATNNAARGYLD